MMEFYNQMDLAAVHRATSDLPVLSFAPQTTFELATSSPVLHTATAVEILETKAVCLLKARERRITRYHVTMFSFFAFRPF